MMFLGTFSMVLFFSQEDVSLGNQIVTSTFLEPFYFYERISFTNRWLRVWGENSRGMLDFSFWGETYCPERSSGVESFVI